MCYDFSQHTQVFTLEGELKTSFTHKGEVYQQGRALMLLGERLGDDGTVSGQSQYWDDEVVCIGVGHDVLECYPLGLERSQLASFRQPFVFSELIRGNADGLDFASAVRPPSQRRVGESEGWLFTEHLNSNDAVLLRTSHEKANPANRLIEFFTASGDLIYFIELSGGSLSLPSSATVTRYFPGTEIVRFRHFIDYEPKEGCSLITGSLNPTEIIARIRKPDVEFTYTRYTEDSIPIRQMSVDGKWYDEAEWQDRAAMLAPRENRSETILTNGGGFGSGVREIRPYLLGAGVILIGAGFVFFFRRRNVA